tara:strand:+ start:5081 stop:5872 length:792 start_codon:yes stop_codon:yes gene_type:complete
MSLNYDDIDLGHVARKKDLSDGERMLTLMLSQLDELEYHINNALGSGVGDAEIVKPKKQSGQKVDVMGGTQVTDDSSLGNKQLPRFAAKPSKPNTVKKPAVKKSRDYTGSSLNKEEPKPTPEDWEDEVEPESDYDPMDDADEPPADDESDYDPTDGGDYYKTDMDKLLPLVAAGAKAVDDERKMSPQEHNLLMALKQSITKIKAMGRTLGEVDKELGGLVAAKEKDMRTTKTPASKVMNPQDRRGGMPKGSSPGISNQLRDNI